MTPAERDGKAAEIRSGHEAAGALERLLTSRGRVRGDLARAGLAPQEVARLASSPAGTTVLEDSLARASPGASLDGLRDRLRFALGDVCVRLEGDALRFPLLRLLHFQLLLEQPRLRAAFDSAELELDGGTLSSFLRRNGDADYLPELRVADDAEQRWRGRWAENIGEAFSVMFLEDALSLDLGTLARIPSSAASVSPDFMARTRGGEHVVFESKGSGSWRTHLSQRSHALEQLGKADEDPDIGGPRGFACCLFAAARSHPRSSVFYVEDPPSPFGRLFSRGWESDARRRHLAATLELAGLRRLADELDPMRKEEGMMEGAFAGAEEALAPPPRSPLPPLPKPSEFVLHSPAGPLPFLGSELAADDGARDVRVFLGVSAGLVEALQEPPLKQAHSLDLFEYLAFPELRFPPADGGFIGPEDKGPFEQGVYSVLSDGSLLAIETRKE